MSLSSMLRRYILPAQRLITKFTNDIVAIPVELRLPLQKNAGKKTGRRYQHAVKGMLPKNTLGRQQFRKLKVYAGTDHPHESQMPQELKI